MDDPIAKKKCTKCRVNLPITHFKLKRSEEYNKTCTHCIENDKICKERNKCPHGRQKSICKDCHGSQICSHGRRKTRCRLCLELLNSQVQSTRNENQEGL